MGDVMLTQSQMGLALRAVSEISEESLTVISLKLIDDIRAGKYDDGHSLTSRICVGDLRVVPNWWQNIYYIALVVASASGNLIRLSCRAVGVNPALGDWKQMLLLATSTSNIECTVAMKLIADSIAQSNVAYH
ncbi:hypothetical protein D3C75_396310 [compost metagenome]